MGSWGFVGAFAAIQGAIVLIAAKRSDQIAGQLAEHDYETNLHAFERIEAVHDRVAEVADANRTLLDQNMGIQLNLLQLLASYIYGTLHHYSWSSSLS